MHCNQNKFYTQILLCCI
uniref:Uncharacterized protein n=1 Tax=Arundo donax TaxID=35708 RepID=A0A0A9F933_ARUDO